MSEFYARLPPKVGELVLFDINRATPLDLLLRPAAETKLARILPPAPRNFRTTSSPTRARETAKRSSAWSRRAPRPRPSARSASPIRRTSIRCRTSPCPSRSSDGLYGSRPDAHDDFGIRLGAIAPRGERNVLIASLNSLLRLTSNPFFAYLAERIEEGLPAKRAAPPDRNAPQ